jgi:hypothetical protein
MTEQRGEGSRRWTWLIGATLALVSIVPTGCDSDGNPFVMSLEPFYTDVDLQSDSRLNETWTDKEGDVTFAFEQGREKGKEKVYELVVKEKDGEQQVSGKFEVRLVQLGAFWFLDIYPKSSEGVSEFYRMHFIRAHTITRVEIKQDSIQMAFLSASWLKARIKENSVDTPYVKANDALLLTGTTEELQELVLRYANDDQAFADPLLLERLRLEEQQ